MNEIKSVKYSIEIMKVLKNQLETKICIFSRNILVFKIKIIK